MNKKYCVLLYFMFLKCLLTYGFAATQTMSACTQAAFNVAYTAAANGDTIAFPEGSCSITWVGTAEIAKTNLVIQGQGSGVTILTGAPFSASGGLANGLRVTAIEFRGGPAFQWSGTGSIQNVRFDHCKFYNGDYFFDFYGPAFNVVIDNNTFDTITGEGNYVQGGSVTPAFPYSLGANSNGAGIFYEDNTIVNAASMSHFISVTRHSGRGTIRYNHFTITAWDTIDAHDNYEGQSEGGAATWEIYNNVFHVLSGIDKRIINLRGGQGVIYNNLIDGAQPNFISLYSYMICENSVCTIDEPECVWHVQSTHVWNNKYNCPDLTSCDPNDATACCTEGTVTLWSDVERCADLRLNTDYWMTQMPDYIGYNYPHPLTAGISSVSYAPFRIAP